MDTLICAVLGIISNLENEDAKEYVKLTVTALKNAGDTAEAIEYFIESISKIDKRIKAKEIL